MSKRFLFFLIAVWYPLMFIGGLALQSHFQEELRGMSTAALAFIFYAWVIAIFAPGLWVDCFRKSK